MSEIVAFEGVYLRSYLRPFEPWLNRADVTEILMNRPGELWVEVAGAARMERVAVPEADAQLLTRLAAQIARETHQGVNRENPLLGATLPDGARIQMVGPPAAREGWALAIRRHVVSDVPLEAYARPEAAEVEAASPDDDFDRDQIAWLQRAVRARKTVLISGGASSGKTTFLNSLLKEVPEEERIILVEDTPEIRVSQPNALGLVAVKGDLGEARVTVEDLLQASLRLRPDRLIVGEIRGKEAATFLRAINTGHTGSFTTVHANTPAGALEQIALMVMQAGLPLSRSDTIAYVSSIVDVVVQLSRQGGRRFISDIQRLRP